MTRCKVRVTPHHLDRLPTSELLQRVQRCVLLYVPGSPRMAKIVPAEVGDACPVERRPPGLDVDVLHRPPSMREHERRMLLTLPS